MGWRHKWTAFFMALKSKEENYRRAYELQSDNYGKTHHKFFMKGFMPYGFHSDVFADSTAEKGESEQSGLWYTAHIFFSENFIQSGDNKGDERNGGEINECRWAELIHYYSVKA